MNFHKRLIAFLLITTYSTLNTSPIHAQIDLENPLNTEGTNIGTTFAVTRVEPVIQGAATWLLLISGLIMFLCILISGIFWLTSRGDSGQVQAARDRLTNCLLGLGVVTLALAIFAVIQYFFGLEVIPT